MRRPPIGSDDEIEEPLPPIPQADLLRRKYFRAPDYAVVDRYSELAIQARDDQQGFSVGKATGRLR